MHGLKTLKDYTRCNRFITACKRQYVRFFLQSLALCTMHSPYDVNGSTTQKYFVLSAMAAGFGMSRSPQSSSSGLPVICAYAWPPAYDTLPLALRLTLRNVCSASSV